MNTSVLAEAFQTKDQKGICDFAGKESNRNPEILFLAENTQRATKGQGTEFDSGAEDEEQPVDEQDIGREVVLFVFDHGQTKGQDQGDNLSGGGEEFEADVMKEAVLVANTVEDQTNG